MPPKGIPRTKERGHHSRHQRREAGPACISRPARQSQPSIYGENECSEPTATAVPTLSGQFLSRTQASRVVRAFFAADLHLGAKRIDQLTRLQSAYLARVSPTYVNWAEKRLDQRPEIEAGLIPLVPATPIDPNGNGTTLAMSDTGIDDAWLQHLAHIVGADRMLAAAIAAGH